MRRCVGGQKVNEAIKHQTTLVGSEEIKSLHTAYNGNDID